MTPYVSDPDFTLHVGDALEVLRELPDESVDCVVTSPPYWGLRDYGTGEWETTHGRHCSCSACAAEDWTRPDLAPCGTHGPECPDIYAPCDHGLARIALRQEGRQTDLEGGTPGSLRDKPITTCGKCGAQRVDQQLGLEPTPDAYVARMVEVFREVRRVLAPHGTCWVNLGDSYATGTSTPSKPSTDVDNGYWQKADKLGRSRIDGREAGLKPKDLVGIPWRVAFALQQDGWYLRSDIIWAKPNPMPESVTDRPTKAHEYVFLLTKQPRYWFDAEAVREPWAGEFLSSGARNARFKHGGVLPNERKGLEGQQAKATGEGTYTLGNRRALYESPNVPQTETLDERSTDGGRLGRPRLSRAADQERAGRNVRSVWEIATQPYPEAHFATFPEELARRCILAGCKEGGTVLDPFIGSGTVAVVARAHGRKCVGIELSPEYAALCAKRTRQLSLLAT